MQPETKVNTISIDLIIPNRYQPRKNFDETSLNELAVSIKEYGILNPILVRKFENKYEIIAGERRYRAAKKLEFTEVPVIIKDLEDQKIAEIALIENLQRENLTPIEEAKSYEEIMRLSNMTQQTLGKLVGKSQSAVANKLRLLSLPENIQQAIGERKISERHARSLMSIKDPDRQKQLLNKVIKEKLTVKELDNLIKQKTISEEEIQTAINDIMKSLEIISEDEEANTKKEEKESDNMNNGNFFPNFNNTMAPNNNMSLNNMNMQSMEQPQQMTQIGEMVMPTPPVITSPTTPIQSFDPTAATYPQTPQPTPELPTLEMPNNNMNPMAPDVPLFNPEVAMPSIESAPTMYQEPVVPETIVPETMMNQPMPSPVIEPIIEPVVEPTPTVEMEPADPVSPQPVIETPVDPIPEPVVVEEPIIIADPVSPMYEVPVTATATLEVPVQVEDNLTKTRDFLDQNGIPYKLYNNETGHCIIIEL